MPKTAVVPLTFRQLSKKDSHFLVKYHEDGELQVRSRGFVLTQAKIDTCQSGQTPKNKVQSNPKASKTKPEGHGPQQTPEKVIGLNKPPITEWYEGVSNDQSKRRSRRQATVKFLGRDIRFKGVAVSGERPRWRYGTILDVVRGKDGAADAVYEILYQGDDQSCQVTDVLSNYQKGLLQFTDL